MAFCESLCEESPKATVQPDAAKDIFGRSGYSYFPQPTTDEPDQDIASLQRDDARFKAIWSSEMGVVGQESVYSSVSVLLISWNDEAGDLRTGEEVERLRDTLEDKYNFIVDDKRLDASRPAQIQLNKHLANFVDERHDEDGLLIVYYAGHGVPGNVPGYLTLAGSRNPEHHDSERKKMGHEIEWHRAENLIKDSWGDVFIIFDCCAAGSLGRDIGARGRWARRAFEFLGATSADDTTPEPGPTSFTSGLIWALDKLATADGFLVSDLLREITSAPQFPPNQYPVHYDRDKPSLKKIFISPSLRDGSRQKEAVAKRPTVPAERVEFLDLRVQLSHHPTADDIANIARTLKQDIKTNSLPAVQHIAWGKLSAIEGSTGRFGTLARSLSVWQKLGRKARDKVLTQNALQAHENLNNSVASRDPGPELPSAPGPSRKRRRRRRRLTTT